MTPLICRLRAPRTTCCQPTETLRELRRSPSLLYDLKWTEDLSVGRTAATEAACLEFISPIGGHFEHNRDCYKWFLCWTSLGIFTFSATLPLHLNYLLSQSCSGQFLLLLIFILIYFILRKIHPLLCLVHFYIAVSFHVVFFNWMLTNHKDLL